MKDDLIWDLLAVLILLIFVLVVVQGCGVPKISDIVNSDGINCKADIVMPEGARGGETVQVKVRIYDCQEPTKEERDAESDIG